MRSIVFIIFSLFFIGAIHAEEHLPYENRESEEIFYDIEEEFSLKDVPTTLDSSLTLKIKEIGLIFIITYYKCKAWVYEKISHYTCG